jgi:hypothetical protein
LDHCFDLSSGIVELFLADIKFKIKQENECICHLTHFTHVKRKNSLVKFGVFFVVVLIKLHSESESAVQYTLAVTSSKDSCIPSLFISCN